MVVFGIGAMAAGFAGIVNAPVGVAQPPTSARRSSFRPSSSSSSRVGSFVPRGAVVGGLIAGEIISLTSMVNPATRTSCCSAAMTLCCGAPARPVPARAAGMKARA
jgi:branched-chain amino acid transport system permease protein